MNKKDIKKLVLIVVSAFIYALNVKVLVESANLYPGGCSGVSLLLVRIFKDYLNINLSFGVIYTLLNGITAIVVYKYIGKKFMFFSILHFVLTGIFSSFIPSFNLTDDILLATVFGGIINGFAISIALKNNASSGGTDFISIFLSTKYNIVAWDYIMAFNAIILIIAGLLYGFETSLYSIIFQFCSTQIIKVLHDRFKHKQLIIITEKRDEVSSAVLKHVRHGITSIDSTGMYKNHPNNVLLITCGAFQVSEIIKYITTVDPHAFINVINVEKISGNYYQLPLE